MTNSTRLAALHSNGYELDSRPERLGWLTPVPTAERQDRTALWQRLYRDGYLYFKGILDREQVLAFRRYYFETLAPTGLIAPGSDPLAGITHAGPIDQQRVQELLFQEIVTSKQYAALCSSPEIVDFYRWFLDGEIFLHKRKIVRHVAPGRSATGAHYDLVYLREGTDRLYTSWIPLGDCPVEQGGLIYLAGSHPVFLEKDRASTKKEVATWLTKDVRALADRLDTRWLIADYEAGDMVIHTPYMVHASLDNVSPDNAMRLSTDIRYQLASDAIDQRWQQHWHATDGL